MQRENDDSMIQQLCGADDDDAEQGQRLDAKNIAICHLTLKALSFKHGIKLGASGENPETVNTGADGIMPYMKCILTNIFMKRIIGQTCLQQPGGTRAFDAAQAFVGTTGTAERNSTCEGKDLQSGDRSKRAEDWTLLYIMERWFQRHKTRLRDGDVGVLGRECKVNISGQAEADKQKELDKFKKTVEDEMQQVGQNMKENITKILNAVKACTDIKCVKGVIQQEMEKEKREKTGASPRDTPEFRATTTDPGTGGAGKSGSPGGSSAKPASPVAPAPAKPVAAKPGPAVTPATVTPGSGTTTTSGGGGGQAGKGDVGGTGKGQNAWEQCLGTKILDWKPREIYVVLPDDDEQWNKVKDVLEEFMEYLEEHNQHFDGFGANCNNAGWSDFGDGNLYKEQRVADMMRCRLMSGALWFANKGGTDEAVNRLRCEVANVFGHLLKKMYCKDKGGYKRGTEYAWETFRNMKSEGTDGAGKMEGPVINSVCTECGYGEHKRNINAINLAIAQWLLKEGKISSEIAQMEKAMPCETYWKDYIKPVATPGQPIKDSVSDQGKEKIKEAQEKMTAEVTKIIEKVQKAADEIKEVAKKIIDDAKKKEQQDVPEVKNADGKHSKAAEW
ncbi:hypothetical protein AK88_04259 [Plasmodium fragile]|uniref:Schizont-infected cell agglutination extracellular alpha domain-containing protein n=1 Tax=Plasmodium fragile TaxID=5857 RepID=A0A0D9QGH9_PLAFR|nr:uncharacterized protein AK88_04259 [Plasmodium fragile]KJP86068.1 hypothetical protein AK88_04259 [Plasmodium fragile]